MEFNKDILRWVLLIGAAPIWWPFLVALWRDFNRALREDGGLMGAPLGQRELDMLRSEQAREPESLRSVPIVRPGDRRSTRMQSPGPRAPSGRSPSRGPTTKPGGFKDSKRPRGR